MKCGIFFAVTAICVLAWFAPIGNASIGATGNASASTTVRSAPPLSGVNITGLGYGTPIEDVNQEIAWAHSLDAHVIRVEIPWSSLEPSQGQIEPQALAFTDYLINRASAAGIKVVALVMRTPCWASSAPASLLSTCESGRSSKANAWPPSEPSTYGSFVAFLAARYGSKLAAIEVWNEPDQANEDYFAGPNKAQRYAAVLRAAYPAIKRADPSMTVLAGSLVGSNGAFLRALYAAGIKGYYDGLAVHFYNLTLAGLRYTHEVQLANGDSTPMWLTEFGWSSCWPGQSTQQEQPCVTPQTQAANLSNVYRSLARTPWIAAEIMYQLQGSLSENFGVLTETGARKPSFAALRNVFVSPFGKPSPVTVRLSRRGGRVVASGSGPVGDYMQLEAFRGRRAVYKALFTLNRFNRYSIALPKSLGTRNLSVKVFQYWTGTARAARASI
ncbi:MAG: glycosyl hydrolase [Solirubrobacteraceae bacterium]